MSKKKNRNRPPQNPVPSAIPTAAELTPDLRWLFPLLIIVAALCVYGNSFSVPFLLDDRRNILENPAIHHLGFSKALLTDWRPVVLFSLALNYAFSGLSPAGYHVFNLMIHILTGLLFYGVLRRTLEALTPQSPGGKASASFAFSAALLWTVHPLATQAVTYVIQRAESLMALFYLLTLYCFIRGVNSPRKNRWFAGSVTACLLGIGSKEMMVTAPLVVLLYDKIFISRSFGQALRRHGGLYLGLCTVILLLTFKKFGPLGLTPSAAVAESVGGLKGITRLEYALTQPGVIFHYLKLCVWPHPLCFDYEWPVARAPEGILFPLAGILFLISLSVWLLKKKPALGFLGLSFFIILAPTSSFIPITDIAVEHRMYLPLAVVLTIVAAAAGRFLNIFSLQPRPQTSRGGFSAWTVVALITLTLGSLTISRNRDYRSETALWENVLKSRPQNARAHDLLGIAMAREGQTGAALVHFKQALRIDPEYAQAHANIGITLIKTGNVDKALEHFREAVRLKPHSAEARTNLGAALVRKGEFEEALVHYNRALEISPLYKPAHLNLALLLMNSGEVKKAREHLQSVLLVDPGNGEALRILGSLDHPAGTATTIKKRKKVG